MTAPLGTLRPHFAFLAVACLVVASAFALWGEQRGQAALAGAVVATVNWVLVRFIGARMFASAEGGENPAGSRAFLSMLLMAKIGALMAVVYLLIQRLRLDPLGLAFGLGVMFLGPLVASLFAGESGRPMSPSAATAASKEQ